MADGVNTYPNLGFNPVPGVPEHVEMMGTKISTAVDSLTQANQLLGRLRNSGDSVWQGDAGTAFREHFNGKLATELIDAHTSLGKAVGLLRGWHADLVSFKDAASRLDHEAADAKQQHAQAQASVQHARSNPDLQLAGKEFPDQKSLQQAQERINTAESSVRQAEAKATDAEDVLSSIMKRAKELEALHDQVARKVADELKAATKNLAPQEPGLLSQMWNSFASTLNSVGDWVQNHLDVIHSVLSTVSAIAGLVAMFTPPPVDVIAMGVAIAASAGALACDFSDPKFRHGMSELLHGNFNKNSLGALKTAGLDGLGLIPGASAAAKGAVVGVKALKGGEAAAHLPGIVDIASGVAHSPGLMSKMISKIPGTGTALEATKLIDKGASASTMVTQNMVEILWRGKSVVSDVYHDAKKAV